MSQCCPILFFFSHLHESLPSVILRTVSTNRVERQPQVGYLSLSAIPVSAYQCWGQAVAKFCRPRFYPCDQEAGCEKMRGNFFGKLKKTIVIVANIENYLKKDLYLI